MWRWVMIGVLAVGVPLLSWRSARVADEVGLGRRQLYLNAAVSLWILGALGFLSLALDGVSLSEVGLWWPHEPLSFLSWSAGLTIAGLGVFVAAHRARRAGRLPPEEPLLLRMRPRGAGDALLVVLVLSPSAGVCEEFLYRGLVFDMVRDAAGPAAAPPCRGSSSRGPTSTRAGRGRRARGSSA